MACTGKQSAEGGLRFGIFKQDLVQPANPAGQCIPQAEVPRWADRWDLEACGVSVISLNPKSCPGFEPTMTLASGADQALSTGKSYDRGPPDGLTAGEMVRYLLHAVFVSLTVNG
jgi:hypothetical protein